MGAWPGEVEIGHGDSELATKLESALESIQHFMSGCSAAWAETFNRRSEREWACRMLDDRFQTISARKATERPAYPKTKTV